MRLFLEFCVIVAFIFAFVLLAKRFAPIKKIYVIAAMVVMTLYILWRLFFTLAFDDVWSAIFSILFFAAELFGLYVSMFFMLLFATGDEKPEERPVWAEDYNPSIDILICTYDEPIRLVMASAIAAKNLTYENKTIYICDDGHRPELKGYAEQFGVNYITREDNRFAKAGNINHALSVTNGELFALLDSDFIVKEGFLIEAIPYFQDENTALIQYPQSFYNKDSFQLVDPNLYNEQDFFMRFIEPHLSEHNAIVHIGTNALIRRSAVEAVGGIPLKSITEDMVTGMMLQNAGYRTLYVNKTYALGLAPSNATAVKNQRQRWARGVIQVFRNYHPMRMKGLKTDQKMIYLSLAAYWYTSFQKLFYIILPTLYTVFGIYVMHVDIQEVMLIIFPSLLFFALTMRLLVGKTRTFIQAHLYDVMTAPYHAGAVIKELFGVKSSFKVTPKTTEAQKPKDINSLIVHIILMVWLVFSLVIATLRGMNGAGYFWALIICGLWTVYNLVGLIYAIIAGTRTETETIGEAFSTKITENIEYNDDVFLATDMSFDGIKIKKPQRYAEKFVVGELYDFTIVRSKLKIGMLFVKEDEESLVFQFKSATVETAQQLSKYYVQKLHAVKALKMDEQLL